MINLRVDGIKIISPKSDSIYIGTSNGITRIDKNTGVSYDLNTTNKIQGLSNDVGSVSSKNVVSIVTRGTNAAITYLSYDNEVVSSVTDESFKKLFDVDIDSGHVVDSSGGVVHLEGIISILKNTPNMFVRSFRIINDDDIVDFGVDGEAENISIPEAFVGEISAVGEINIYNDSEEEANANVLISFTGRVEDGYLELSENSSGPFFSIRENATSLPADFPWENGFFDNTMVVDDYVTISGTEGPFIYYSPVIDTQVSSIYEGLRVFWVSEETGLSYIDFKDTINGKKSIMFRESNISPEGLWTTGQLANEGDSLWDIETGSLSFNPSPNYSIDSVTLRYVQFKVNFVPNFRKGFMFGTNVDGASVFLHTDIEDELPKLTSLGIEIPIRVFNIQPNSYGSVYIRSNIPSPPLGVKAINTIRQANIDVWWDKNE